MTPPRSAPSRRNPFTPRLAAALALLLGALVACKTTGRAFPPARSVEIPDLDARLVRLTHELEAQRAAAHVPGMALAIVKDDELIYARGFGSADLETGRATAPDTLFAIGSTTKAFTSTAIGMLVDEGRMRWDDSITAYLPGFELHIDSPSGETGADVTVRDLLCHRTGFTRMSVLWAAGTTDAETVLHAASRAEAWAPFRSSFLYNNVMYLAAGEAAARVAGMRWGELVATRLFEPLGMGDSSTSLDAARGDARLATGYLWDKERGEFRALPMRSLASIAPAGAINSNVLDMARWVRLQLGRGAFEGERLLSRARIEETWTGQVEAQPGTEYGLGWFVGDWNGQRVVEHGGNIDGFATLVALLPESKLGFVLLTNVSSTPLQQSARGIVWNALLGDPVIASDAIVAGVDFGEFLGEYTANFGPYREEAFEVVVRGNRLALDIPGQTAFELLEPNADGRRPFALVPDQLEVGFERDESGRVVVLELYQAGFRFELPRVGYVAPSDLGELDPAPYLGSYRDPRIGDLIQIVVQNGRLACDYPRQMVYGLRPPRADDGDHIWRFRVSDTFGLEFHLGDDGRAASLTFHERGATRVCPRVGVEGVSDLLTAEGLHELRGSAARGAALLALGATRMTGAVRFAHAGIGGSIETLFDGPERFEQTTTFAPFGWSRAGYDGERGWSDSPFAPSDELSGQRLAQLRLSHPATSIGDWSQTFDSVRVTRAAELDGRHHWVVRLKSDEAPELVAYVDSRTGDVKRMESETIVPGLGALSQTTTYGDYRDVGGLRIPFSIDIEDAATGRFSVRYATVE